MSDSPKFIEGNIHLPLDSFSRFCKLRDKIHACIRDKQKIEHGVVEEYLKLLNISFNENQHWKAQNELHHSKLEALPEKVNKTYERFKKLYDFEVSKQMIGANLFDFRMSLDGKLIIPESKEYTHKFTFKDMVSNAYHQLYSDGLFWNQKTEEEKDKLVLFFYDYFDKNIKHWLPDEQQKDYFKNGKKKYKLDALSGYCAGLVLGGLKYITNGKKQTNEDIAGSVKHITPQTEK